MAKREKGKPAGKDIKTEAMRYPCESLNGMGSTAIPLQNKPIGPFGKLITNHRETTEAPMIPRPGRWLGGPAFCWPMSRADDQKRGK